MATLPLSHFEKIDGLYSQLIRMGDFLNCADPRGFIGVSNRLFDACIDAGMSHDVADHQVWAVEAITRSLVAA